MGNASAALGVLAKEGCVLFDGKLSTITCLEMMSKVPVIGSINSIDQP